MSSIITLFVTDISWSLEALCCKVNEPSLFRASFLVPSVWGDLGSLQSVRPTYLMVQDQLDHSINHVVRCHAAQVPAARGPQLLKKSHQLRPANTHTHYISSCISVLSEWVCVSGSGGLASPRVVREHSGQLPYDLVKHGTVWRFQAPAQRFVVHLSSSVCSRLDGQGDVHCSRRLKHHQEKRLQFSHVYDNGNISTHSLLSSWNTVKLEPLYWSKSLTGAAGGSGCLLMCIKGNSLTLVPLFTSSICSRNSACGSEHAQSGFTHHELRHEFSTSTWLSDPNLFISTYMCRKTRKYSHLRCWNWWLLTKKDWDVSWTLNQDDLLFFWDANIMTTFLVWFCSTCAHVNIVIQDFWNILFFFIFPFSCL